MIESSATLEENFPEIAEIQPEILARHSAEADLDEKGNKILALGRRKGGAPCEQS